MNATDIKKWLYENNKVEELLSELGCHSIKYHPGHYWTCANPDGDNKSAISVYAPSLNIVNYTRQLPEPSDIITLVEYIKDLNFFKALKFLCDFLGVDYYKDLNEDRPQSLVLTDMMRKIRLGVKDNEEDNEQVKPIPEIVLSYYEKVVNDLFKNDGISYRTQQEFEIGYDGYSNRITIPIRDELGNLCGIKGRLFKKEVEQDELKYIYLEPVAKSKILYGLYKTERVIKAVGKCLVGESEKSVMQLWSYGYQHCVGLGGKKISKTQIEKLCRLAVDIILCLDKDVNKEELQAIANSFPEGYPIFAVIDEGNILDEKESPMDNRVKFEKLIQNNVYKIR